MRPGDSKDLGLIGHDRHDIDELWRHFLCLRYLLRANPRLWFSVREVFEDDDSWFIAGCAVAQLVLHTTLDRRLRDRFLPACLTERVPSLQRLCRSVIRRAVRHNNNLYNGVFHENNQQEPPPGTVSFRIPRHLVDFLNLNVD